MKHNSIKTIVAVTALLGCNFTREVIPLPQTRTFAITFFVLIGMTAGTWAAPQAVPSQASDLWHICQTRGKIYADCGRNVSGLIRGWIQLKRDPKTHLYSRGRTWDYHNEAADHYSSLVLMAYYVAPEHNEPGGTFHQTMVNSRKLCATSSGIPAVYNLKTHQPDRMASFGELSEWLRDGLIRIVEAAGTDNIWYEEMVRLTDAMLAEAERRGGVFSAFTGHEPWGNMLQTLARLYAFSGDEKYLLAAEQIADRLLLDPEHALQRIRYQDHGCELTPGLTELFVLESKLRRPKAEEYRKPLERLLDRILADAAHPVTGLFCAKGPRGNNFGVCGAAVSAAQGRRDACTTSSFFAAPYRESIKYDNGRLQASAMTPTSRAINL